MVTDDSCKGCVFHSSSHSICNYLLIMDVRRGCPSGAGCDKKMTKKEWIAMGLQKDWNKQAGQAMWAAGRGDAEIAKAMGVTQGTISYFRRKHWEPERDAASEVEQLPHRRQPPVEDVPGIDPDMVDDVEAPAEECQAAEDGPAPVEITIEVPECEPVHNEVEQEVTVYMPPSKEGPGAAKTEEVDNRYPQLIQALEGATGNLTGMDAVMTAQIISALWGWTDKSDLLEAKACLDYLIRRHDRA